jgi:hypothetical protein
MPGTFTIFVTEGGAFIADESGNELIAGDEAADLRMQLDELRQAIGRRGFLYRRQWDQLTTQFKTARLLNVRRSTVADDRTVKAELECSFEAPDAKWRASLPTTPSANLVSGGTITLVAENVGSETAEDGILTIAASGGTISSVRVECAITGVSWTWTGSLTTGQSLVVDAGALTVRQAGADAYGGFALGSGHSASTWLPLAPGINSLQISSIGPGSAALTFYAQYL